jgi:hypothetical protein
VAQYDHSPCPLAAAGTWHLSLSTLNYASSAFTGSRIRFCPLTPRREPSPMASPSPTSYL